MSLAAAAAAALFAGPAGAQQMAGGAAAGAPPDSGCVYARCALGLAPRWSGLDVVRGTRAERVGSLGFFWPRDVRRAFAGSAPAARYAGRALRYRRIGAALTDIGGALLAAGAVQVARRGELHGAAGGLTLGGLALLGAGVPAQFAADGELSRAVWEYNTRFDSRPY